MSSTRHKKFMVILGGIFLGWFLLFSSAKEGIGSAKETVNNISAKSAYTLIEKNKKNKDFVVLDIRTKAEFDTGHIENALHIDYYTSDFRDRLSKLDKNKTYLFHCKSGGRSGRAVSIFNNLQFGKLLHMNGGFDEWKSDRLPVERQKK